VVEEGAPSPGAKGLGVWLTRIAPRSAHGLVTVAILPDGKVRALNRKFRRTDRPTDVLSFPGEGAPGGSVAGVRDGKRFPERLLGDIAISRGIAQKQAKLLGHSLRTEFRVLALHGLLHLLGYDHESDAGRMARVEARLRRQGGLPVGLIARTARARRSRDDR
jgi:probable rRNA maturation factor